MRKVEQYIETNFGSVTASRSVEDDYVLQPGEWFAMSPEQIAANLAADRAAKCRSGPVDGRAKYYDGPASAGGDDIDW